MNIRQTLAMKDLKANAAGTQATVPDSRSSDEWIKNYLDKKQERLNDTRMRLNGLMKNMHHMMQDPATRGMELEGAWNVYKPSIAWEQHPEKIAGGGKWAVTDLEGLIISTWNTREEAEKAAFPLYKGLAPSSTGATAGARVVRLSAGGPGSGCKGPACGRPRVFESKGSPEMRKLQYRFQKNGKVSIRVAGKGKLFTWSPNGTLMPGETPEQWLKRMDKDVTEIKAADIFEDEELGDRTRAKFLKHPKPKAVQYADRLRMGDRRPSSHGQGSAGTGGTGGPSGGGSGTS